MKYTLIITLAFSLSFLAHAMDEQQTQEAILRQELAQLCSQLDHLEKRDDAYPAKIQEIRDQLTATNSAIDSITKLKESLE